MATIFKNSSTDKYFELVLAKKGYLIAKKIADTLQGRIYLATDLKSNKTVVVKITSINLTQTGVTYVNGKPIQIKENIIKETKLMKYLQKNTPPKGFLKYIAFFKDTQHYYLIMDYGGTCFFDYIKHETTRLKEGKLNAVIWRTHVKKMFKQMVLYVNWLHNNNVCHLDISLENCLINENIVNFCDFGLAEYFANSDFSCKKYCGKPNYYCPEIYKRKCFNASKADVWTLGVCLFLMLAGCPAYHLPSLSDPYYKNLYHGYLREIIDAWKIKAMSKSAINLLENVFVEEKDRISMKDLVNHKFIANVNIYVNEKDKNENKSKNED